MVDAVRGYRNDDGGLGHGLEPDKRSPASQPLDVEFGLQALVTANAIDAELVHGMCQFLARVADRVDASGAVPLLLPGIESFPRADHWGDWAYVPGLNPTAGLVGLLRRLDVTHDWLDRAAQFCASELAVNGLPADAHALWECLIFAEAGGSPPIDALVEAIGDRLSELSPFRLDPDGEGYGLTPLHLAPTPDSPWRVLFADDLIERHLERLERDQEPDGGWSISWSPPGPAAVLENRAVETLRALRCLTAYGRLS